MASLASCLESEKDRRRLIALLKDQSNNERKKHPTERVIGGKTLFLLNTEASVRVLRTRARCCIPKGWVKPWIETPRWSFFLVTSEKRSRRK